MLCAGRPIHGLLPGLVSGLLCKQSVDRKAASLFTGRLLSFSDVFFYHSTRAEMGAVVADDAIRLIPVFIIVVVIFTPIVVIIIFVIVFRPAVIVVVDLFPFIFFF